MPRLASLAPLTAGALGLWLGVEAIRAFFTIIVWNVAEDLPSTQLGLVGAAFWIAGLLGAIPARVLRGRTGGAPGGEAARVALLLGALVAILTILRQATQDETWTAVFAIATMVAWLWWLPAWIHAATGAGRAREIAPAFLAGMALQVSGQVALDGLDLHALPGVASAVAAAILGAAFAGALLVADREPPTRPAAVGGRWGALAVMPWLFLQLTLLGNIGRLESLGAWSVPIAGIVAAAGLALGVVALTVRPQVPALPRLAVLAVLVATGGLLVVASGGDAATVLLVPAQVGLAVLLHAGLALPSPGRIPNPADRVPTVYLARPRPWLATALGGVLFFAFLFTLYSTALDNLGAQVWPAAAVLVALPELLRSRRVGAYVTGRRSLAAPVAIVVAIVAGAAAGSLPARAEQPTIASAPARLTVLNYNIHQGFSRTGYQNLERTAAFLRAQNADIITLQEVPRTWDLSGAVDTFRWLAERLPDYRAVYGPTSRARFGNAIFTRYAPSASGFEWFPFGPSRDQRGFAWVQLDTPAGPLLVITMHMTPYTRADEVAERDGQAQILLDFWASHGKGLVIFAGDYNTDPSDPAYARTVAGGLVDALKVAGLGDRITFRSTGTPFLAAGTEQIDYVFVNPATRVIAADIPETDISDHYPLRVTLDLARP